MSGRKAERMEKEMKKRKIRVVLGICCVTVLFLWIGKGTAAAQELPDGENIERYSETVDHVGALPEPELYIRDETGKEYRLVSSRIINVPVTGRKKYLAGQIVYQAVSGNDVIPESAVMEVNDSESGTVFEAELPLKKTEYGNERWISGFIVTVTFHVYGADRYRFGDILIPHSSGMPPLEMCSREILDEAGFPENEAEIENFSWDGDIYCGENGEYCRDAAVSVRRKVWDCTAVYEGETPLPDYNRYRLLSEYEPAAESPAEPDFKSMADSGTGTPDLEQENGTEKEKDPKVRWVAAGITASVSLFLILLLAAGFRKLRKAAQEADKIQY